MEPCFQQCFHLAVIGKDTPPLSMNLLSNQKLDENTVKHCSNLLHWVSSLYDLYPAILLAIGHMSK